MEMKPMEIECIILTTDTSRSNYLSHYAYSIGEISIKTVSTDIAVTISKIIKQTLQADILIIDIPTAVALKYAVQVADFLMVVIVSDNPLLAARAYEIGVMDFLLQPVTQERFFQSILKLRNCIGKPFASVERVGFRNSESNETNYFELQQILYIEARGNFCLVHTVDKKVISTYVSLTDISAQLGSTFMRVHRSYVVNLGKVVSLAGNLINLSGGIVVPLSRHYKKIFLQKLQV